MDWSKGYSASYYVKKVDPVTWRDLNIIRITGGNIERERDGLRESASVTCTEYDGREQWIRIYLDTSQNGAYDHVAMFTGLATSPKWNFEGRRKEMDLECYSVLKPVEDIVLQRGWYASAGANGAELVQKLLEPTPAPVFISGTSPKLKNSIVAEDGETNLTMIDKILKAINWRLRISGDGAVSIEGSARGASASLDPVENDLMETSIEVSHDWFSVPNIFMAIDDDMTAVARDDSVDSPLSTVSRGREVWEVETNCDLAENETIAEYAQRMLTDAQRVSRTVEYSRRYIPDVIPGDLIMLRYPEQEISGLYLIESQSIELGHGATTSEEVTAYGG